MSVTINGVYLPDINWNIKQGSDIPATPNTRDKTLQIPERDGLIHFGSTMSELSFTLECRAIRENNAEVQSAIRELNRLLLDDYGRPKELEIIYDYEPDKHIKAKFAGGIPLERRFVAGDLSIPFTAYDPWYYSNVYADEVTWGSTDITFSSTYLLGHSGSENGVSVTAPRSVDLYVSGYTVQPIIEIDGSADNVTFSSNGKSFSLPYFGNVKWVIDCENYTVTQSGFNGMPSFEGDFLELTLDENTMDITGDGLNFNLTVRYRDKYM